MSAIDGVLQAQAYQAIKAYGAPVTLQRTAPGVYNPTTGTGGTPTVTTTGTFGILDTTSIKTLGFKYGDDLVRSGDIQITIPAKNLTFAPELGDTLVTPQWPYIIAGIRPVYSGSVAVIYECLGRK